MKKKLDTNTVMNELRGESVFFPEPTETENNSPNSTALASSPAKQRPSRLQTSKPASCDGYASHPQ